MSDLALCQRCPALLAYKIHMGKSSAWRVGIKGNGEAYGSVFHKHIARVFFEGASRKKHPLYRNIFRAVSGLEGDLQSVVRDDIFMPFLEAHSERLASGQILAMAKGIQVWTRAMSEFFRCIPSLTRQPEYCMPLIFSEPERRLQGCFEFYDGRLMITGCYDALLFNPDTAETRLFEFKGYRKSDVTVPLSQSLIYSWLLWKGSGIIPSIEIIYLDEEEKSPDIFASKVVGAMMHSTLPGLFRSAFDVISLKGRPKNFMDKDLCSECRFRRTCGRDMTKLFAGRHGSSMISVLVFFLVAMMITAQVFFFFENSADSIIEERKLMQIRFRLDALVDEAKHALATGEAKHNSKRPGICIIDGKAEESYIGGNGFHVYYIRYGDDGFHVFYDGRKNESDPNEHRTKIWERHHEDGDAAIFDLNYDFLFPDPDGVFEGKSIHRHFANNKVVNAIINTKKNAYTRLFPPLGTGYFLIRAQAELPAGNHILHQIVVEKLSNGELRQESFEEVYY